MRIESKSIWCLKCRFLCHFFLLELAGGSQTPHQYSFHQNTRIYGLKEFIVIEYKLKGWTFLLKGLGKWRIKVFMKQIIFCSCCWNHLLKAKTEFAMSVSSVEEKAAKDVERGMTVLWIQLLLYKSVWNKSSDQFVSAFYVHCHRSV